MRQIICMNRDWQFTGPDKQVSSIDLPHTWNSVDGQDGGNDYRRCLCRYRHNFKKPAFDAETQEVWLEFNGVNASAAAAVNGHTVCTHDGGYSTFRVEITDLLEEDNLLIVDADNCVSDRVYPQKADFTFYGGIYRDVNLIIVDRHHFALDYFGGPGIRVTARPCDGYAAGDVQVDTWTNGDEGTVALRLLDQEGREVASGEGKSGRFTIPDVHLWNGLASPYLYTAVATLYVNGKAADEVRARFGVRDFRYDPKNGFFLNGASYPLRGVSRHQDRKGVGNALSREMHREDMDLICEIGANTIRLAHYQHDQYFYDLCDERGMVVWAEIPYISEHMPNGRENTISQMKELIIQNYNHPSIVCWGVSNEITISTKDKKDMLDNHHVLNDLAHEMDKTRFTTLACYAVCGPFNKVAHITDVVSWNLYLGWYVPGMWLNDVWMRFFHTVYPNRCLGYSEYGCEGMPNLHSAHPRRGDHTEEYQAKYHEYMLRCFDRNPYLWATHVWNMFDFAADARDQGGEPGMNHKGLITFDRRIKKDSFYLYKAYWSQEPFVHICSKRFRDRTEKKITVKVYSNQREVTLYLNGNKLETQTGSRIFTFTVPLDGEPKVRAVSGSCSDEAVFRYVNTPNPAYKLVKAGDKGANWTK